VSGDTAAHRAPGPNRLIAEGTTVGHGRQARHGDQDENREQELSD
jgi:hypothetical protein